jgi:Uncharacterised nucleotidyltransferase
MSPTRPGRDRATDADGPPGCETSSIATAHLLWEACRRAPDPASIRGALANGADLPWAAAVAQQHRIAALLWRALVRAGVADTQAEGQRSLADYSEVLQAEALLLLPHALSAALRPLVGAGLEPVVLKGPAVAARYPSPGLRPMEDIDLLLPRRQHRAALATLTAAGWEIVRAAGRDRYDSVLEHPEVPWLALELHYGFEAPFERVTALDPDRFWARRIPIDCLGTTAFGLSLPDEVVFLAVHAGKPFHGFERLMWIADLAMVVGAAEADGPALDWDRVRSAADEGDCRTRVSAALALARNAGVDAPPELFGLPAAGWRGDALAALVDPEWPLRLEEISTFHLRYALTDSRRRRATLVAGFGHGLSSAERVQRWSTLPWLATRRWAGLRSRHRQESRRERTPEALEPHAAGSSAVSKCPRSREGTSGASPRVARERMTA